MVLNMKRLGKLLAYLFPVIIVVGSLEVALRLMPELIPIDLLQHFHEEMRLKVAVQLDLPNRSDIQPVERDDGGPLLKKYRPNVSITLAFGDEGATDTIITDDLGFCNPPTRSYEREKIDIMAIGDSLTWCTAVEPGEAWPAFLADLTGKSSYNLGFPGIGLYEYLVFLRKYGLQKSPDVVVLNFTEGNDFRDALRYWRFKTHGISEEGLSQEAGPIGQLLGPVSLVYNMAVGTWRELFEPKRTSAKAGDTPLDARLASIDKKSLDFRYAVNFDGERIAFNIRNADRDELKHIIAVSEGLADLSVFLREFRRLADEHDFTPVVIFSPSAHVVYEDYIEFEAPWVKPLARTYSDRLRDYAKEGAERFGYHYLDMTDLLKEEIRRQGAERATKLLYYPGSIHYSVEGNLVVARELAAFLQSLGYE
jgi:lysophospholipase L1-like esterase